MEDSVSKFIIGTCRMLPKANCYTSNVFESMHLQDVGPLESYVIACGSCAEFFIQPLHSCIGDTDFFLMKPHALAFTDEKLVLPYDVRHIAGAIDCLLMEPYPDYPGFVRLRLLGQMRYNWELRTFEFIQANVQRILKTTEMDEHDIATDGKEWCKVGPATKNSITDKQGSLSLDFVQSVWCPQWPNEAKKWPHRKRKHGWPTTTIIQEVVQIGCHVVFAKHPACRNDIHQSRLSFSVAEVILLQSWTPIQQIVYHMLRFFAKRELITKYCAKKDEVLCTYHFKTLMLWSCEEMSPEWWNSSSVIKLCCNLLKKLSKWLKETRCPNYFISQANLFHERFNRKIVDETAKTLNYWYDSNNLSLWFVQYYMQSSYLDVYDANCTHDVFSCEYLLQTREALKAINLKSIDLCVADRLSSVVQEAQETMRNGFNYELLKFFKYICKSVSFSEVYQDELGFQPSTEIEPWIKPYASMLRLLHAANLLERKEMEYDSEWFVEVIIQVSTKPKFFRSKHHNLPRPLNAGGNRSQLYFLKGQDLMENLTGSNDDLEFQCVSKISKGLLRKALQCEDSKTNAIAKATLAYMAALYFATFGYRTAIDLCLRVIMNEDTAKEDTETLNACYMLYIEDITMIIGFYLVFRKTKDASLHYTRRPFFLDLRLSPEVFAHYLTVSTVERKASAFELNNIFQTPTFPLDAILMSITNRIFSRLSTKKNSVFRVYQRTDPMNKLEAHNENRLRNEDDIIELLKEYSLGNMSSFYNEICKDFDINCNTADCYRAAYLYQCRKYSEALLLCERILDESDLQRDLKIFAFTNVMVLPPLDSYFDSEVQCLLGFHTLFCYLSPLCDDLPKTEDKCNWTFSQFFARKIHSEKCLLSEVIEQHHTNHTRACHYFLGRHFLARYLKVRCLIEYCNSLSEAMFEFKELEASLPFEHVIRCFLRQKLRQLQKVVIAKYCAG